MSRRLNERIVVWSEYHYDVNKSAGADEKFKEVQSAYDVLSDPQKQARYDQFG